MAGGSAENAGAAAASAMQVNALKNVAFMNVSLSY